MKKFFSSGLLLFIVCAVAAGSLSLVYKNTKPRIEENERLKRISYRESVLPAVKTFNRLQDKEHVFLGYDNDNNEIGMAIGSRIKGYSGVIEMVVGSDMSGNITGIKIVKQTETPGLGANIEDEDFLNQFVGLNKDTALLRKDNGSIDALSGATISTEAVLKGVKNALAEVEGFLRSKYKDGVFESKVRGYGGLVQVKVKIVHGKIGDIKAIGRYENRRLWNQVKQEIIPKVIDKQDIKGIDIVTGATRSSKALFEALKQALTESKKSLEEKE